MAARASADTKRRLRAIRLLANPRPDRTAEDRLGQIGDVATGKLDHDFNRPQASSTLTERLLAGAASRSPRSKQALATREVDGRGEKLEQPSTDEDEKKKKKRSERAGQDRKERGGQDRGSKRV